jgi:sec-independent protein translocase protein TatB
MFDVSWSELLILAVVTLIFVGPKELPKFLNTIGRYLGVVRRQANEFRSVFEQAMREAEMDEIKKEVRAVSEGVKASIDGVTNSVSSAAQAARIEEPKLTPAAPKAVTSEPAAVTAADPAASTPPTPSEPVMASETIADTPERSILPPDKAPDKASGQG